MAAESIQIFVGSPRAWHTPLISEDRLENWRSEREVYRDIRSVFCHATYLINLASPDAAVYEQSFNCLVINLTNASLIGADAVVLHPGSHRGQGLENAITQLAKAIPLALDASDATCKLLLENSAGAGSSVGRTFEQLAQVIHHTGSDERVGVCLDTQHLWAAGISFLDIKEVDKVIESFKRIIGLDKLGCIHLNDSKVPFGAGVDRHANLGEGFIPEEGMGLLLSHPDLTNLAAVLEVPGESGQGPDRNNIVKAKGLYARGVAARRSFH